MTKPYRLLAQAEARLAEIADWTEATFGAVQADRYGLLIEERLERLSAGTLPVRSCAILTGDPRDADLGFLRAGQHILVIADTTHEFVVVDVLHGRSDLPRHIAKLEYSKDP